MKKIIIPLSFIVLLSIILWGSVSLSGDYITTITVPIRIINAPVNYTLGNITHKEASIQLKGKGWELARLGLAGNDEFYVSANKKIGKILSSLKNNVEINPWLTSSFQVLDISPSTVEFEIDKIITKTVGIKLNSPIEFRNGFGFASSVELEPSEIEISGPASILQNIDSIRTDSLKLIDVSENVDHKINLEKIEHVSLAEDKIKIKFEVQKIVDKSFDDLPIEVRYVPSTKELILFPSKVSVILRGGINKLGRLTNDSIKVFIDYWAVMRNQDEAIEPEIEYPDHTTLIDVRPKKLEYVIKQF